MISQRVRFTVSFCLLAARLLPACSSQQSRKVCVVLDTGRENDKGINEYTLKVDRLFGREAFVYLGDESTDPQIEESEES